MASCDDDFALIGGDEAQSHNHHHQHQAAVVSFFPAAAAAAAHRYVSTAKGGVLSGHPRPSLVSHHPMDSKVVVGGGGGEDHEGFGEAFVQADCFDDEDPGSNNNPFVSETHHQHQHQQQDDDDDGEDNNGKSRAVVTVPHQNQHLQQVVSRSDPKRKDREELSDDGESPTPYCYNSGGSGTKKSRPAAAPSSSSGGDYRKDREEWSDSAIACLLDAYTDKYVQLNRGNLRGRDWEDVATTVSERCDKQKAGKSVEQCKNKVDNLKKRYKVECQRLSSSNLPVSHWPWFKKMEQIVGSSSTSKVATDDDKSPALAGSSIAAMRQVKRYSVAACGSPSLANNFNKKMSNPRWKRVVLKISGAALTGSGPQNVDPKVIMLIAREVALASRVGVEVAIVVGGRNFFCGETWVTSTGTDRTTAYQIGMMASAMNSSLLQASLEKIGVETRVQTAFLMQEIAEPYIRRRAIRHLEKGRVVIFGGIVAGTGNPLFATDTAAALRASEINAEAVLKGVNTDVYECHSRNNSVTFEHISFRECASRGFTAMDMTALTFCEENNIPVVLFNFLEPGNISRALCGEQVGTLIDNSGRIS
ncbi:uncharacterized protein M6B38_286575 [Iris pallida]|uniref:UMP kinase n=1 Tax=Iris pallida TaxID=29817 RepID=A0AAX6GIS7_IRIPA|nr:uncharacterized protein M6B38_363105 [Iris pallida]KAJ6845673.1 uncharacterized protein M6B38_286575 [Iris pallida]